MLLLTPNLKTRKCKQCKQPFTQKKPLQFLCDVKCAIEYSKAIQAKKEKQDWRVKKVLMKEKLKTLSDWKKDLQALINSIVKWIDYGQPCIATGATTGKRNSGHYISTGANQTIRFNLHNIHIQSEHSNSWKSGDTLRYQDGIIKTYGPEYLERMNSLKSTPAINLNIDDIKTAMVECRKIIKELEMRIERNYIYTEPSTRIKLRDFYNKRIGIYK